MRRTALLSLSLAVLTATATLGFTPSKTPASPNGKLAAIDLPAALHLKNTGGSDGSGLCVFKSLGNAAKYQNVGALDGFDAWMTKRPGGGWPQKVDQMIDKFCSERGVPKPDYLQHTGGEEAVLELALKTGRMPCITYAGRDDFYRSKIAHMVNLAHLDTVDAAIIDNNRPGVWLWMTRSELLQRWRDMQGGWCVILLAPPPPPPATPLKAPAFGQLFDRYKSYTWEGPLTTGDRTFWILKACTGFRCDEIGMLDDAGYHAATRPGFFATETTSPPITPPEAWHAPEKAENFGIDPSRVHQGKRYQFSGQDVDRDTFLGAMTLPDDSGRMHLTIVSDDDAARRAAVQTIASDPSLAALRDRVHLQCYRSTDWAVQARGLTKGITLQNARSAGGVRIYTADEISPATVAEAIRRTDPNWTPPTPMPSPAPPATPTPNSPATPATPKLPVNGQLVLALLAGAIILLHLRSRS